jgi:nucleoside-diphosphate-sugar epimerase
MKKYLVTGGLGFLGAPLVRALAAAGHPVRVLDNSSRGSEARLGPAASDVEVVHGDVRDAETVARAVRGVDAVCHLAFINGTQYFYSVPARVLEVGVKGMLNVLDACIQWSVPELILASSSEVYQTPPSVPTDEDVPLAVPDPRNPRYSYGGAKIISELLAINYGKQYLERMLIFRPHNVYGPDMGWEHVIPQFIDYLMTLKRDGSDGRVRLPIQGNGEQSRSFIYVDDFIDGLLLMMRQGENQNIYNIGTTEELTIRDVALRVAAQMGLEIDVVPGPEAPGGTLRRCPNIDKLRQLGFAPRFNFDAGLARTAPWYIANWTPARRAAAANGEGQHGGSVAVRTH